MSPVKIREIDFWDMKSKSHNYAFPDRLTTFSPSSGFRGNHWKTHYTRPSNAGREHLKYNYGDIVLTLSI